MSLVNTWNFTRKIIGVLSHLSVKGIMEALSIKYKTVDEYISSFPPNIKSNLEIIRKVIKTLAPQAEELISYNMPAFKLKKMLIYYAAHKKHIGFYPANLKIFEVFKDDLLTYKTSKGTIQFPLDSLLPIKLIENIVKYRVKQNLGL